MSDALRYDGAMTDAPRSDAERAFGLKAGAYPYRSRFVTVLGARLHHIDEGEGPSVLMLHGNPTWGFVYRRLIEGLRGDFRCLAPDLAGFGLSEAPAGFSFEPEEHARLVAALMDALDLRDVTLIGHDWGGPIGLGAAALAPGRVSRLCLGNSWAWPVNGDFHFEWFSRLMGGPLGRLAAHRYAVFVNLLMPLSMKRRKLDEDEMAAFRAPFRDRGRRSPMAVFPAAITGSGPWLAEIERFVRTFRGPACLVWPENDFAFRAKELARWQALLPQARTVPISRCGHYLWLDAPADCLAAVRGFLA